MTEVLNLGAAGHPFQQCALLFFTSFAHEDLAMIIGALFVTERGLPVLLAFGSLFCGIVTGDLLVYGLGAAARHNRWLRERLIGERVRRAGAWLDSRVFQVVAVCKLTPALLFPTFIACGWLGVSFARFFAAAVILGLVYTSIGLTLLVVFGETILHHFGYWAWGLLAVGVVVFTAVRVRQPRWRRIVSAGPVDAPAPPDLLAQRLRLIPSPLPRGMPSLLSLTRRIARAERIPPVMFYFPLGLRWLWLGLRYRCLSLPSAANPHIEGGGFWGESKSGCMRQIAEACQKWVAPFVTLRRGASGDSTEEEVETALAALAEKNIRFPLVAKPDIGWQGFGVRLLATPEELRGYIEQYPWDETIILQQHVPYDGECGVFYVRRPGDENGRIYSLTLRYFPHVTGDGKTPLRDLILRDKRAGWKAECYLSKGRFHCGMSEEELSEVPAEGQAVRLTFIGSLRTGALYRNGSQYITPELTRRFDEIAQSMPEFHYGRFDVRFHSLERLQAGEDFAIFEINGAGAEDIRIWDPEMSLTKVYRALFAAQTLVFEFGDLNRKRGFKPTPLREFFRLQRHQYKLITKYPPSG